MKIHSTAIIDSSVEIGDNTVVGPYCILHKGVKIGKNCTLHNNVVIDGITDIGDNNEFFPFTSIGGKTQDLKYKKEPTYLKIGEGNVFREFCTVNRATDTNNSTIISNNSNFLSYTHIGHDCKIGEGVIFSNGSTLGGHVEVENNVVIGGLTAVHQFCKIGQYSILGGCTKVVKDIPPYMICDGNPAKIRGINSIGLKRNNISNEIILKIKQAYKILYRENYNVSMALEKIETIIENSIEIDSLCRFIKNSSRGIY